MKSKRGKFFNSAKAFYLQTNPLFNLKFVQKYYIRNFFFFRKFDSFVILLKLNDFNKTK